MKNLSRDQPLAAERRPVEFADLFGQEEIWAPGKPLWEMASRDAVRALILWGPPGVGKTSLAHLIAERSGRTLHALSATHCGVKDIRAALDSSQDELEHGLSSHFLFMDEIHRLNKGQQDVLLPALENGTIRFVGATTENPSFEVNRAVLSRCLTFQLVAISPESMLKILERALDQRSARLDPEILSALAQSTNGDARQALNLLEAIINATPPGESLSKEALFQFLPKNLAAYDKNGESHYDLISAFIKSVRASHPDAAVYYLARMLEGGESPLFIARRLVILASEDIGNANPTALLLATSGLHAVDAIGMPEARIVLSQVATYLAASPKSNRAYEAIGAAIAEVQKTGARPVPLSLRNAPTQFMKEIGYGKNYAYAHHDPEGARRMSYLPDGLSKTQFYLPSQNGFEKQLGETLSRIKPKEMP